MLFLTKLGEKHAKCRIFAFSCLFICLYQNFLVILQRKKCGTTIRTKLNDTTMATAIKAIPTLYGEEAARFRKAADAAERRYAEHGPIDWAKDKGVLMARQIWANMMQI